MIPKPSLRSSPTWCWQANLTRPNWWISLEQLGLTVYYLKNPATLEDMYANLETVGQLTGHKSEAATLVESLKTRVAAVDEKIAPLSSRPNVYYELDATDPTKPYTAGPGTFVDLLISRAGGLNIGQEMGSQWGQISLEQVVAANPAVIVLGDAAYGTTVEVGPAAAWLERPRRRPGRPRLSLRRQPGQPARSPPGGWAGSAGKIAVAGTI